jgi:preprotein translocase subunit SecD
MLDFPRWKVFSIWAIVLVGILFAIPSLLPQQVRQYWAAPLPQSTINLGLDLAGGSHLLLEADIQDLQRQRLQTMEDTVSTEMRRGDPRIPIADISTRGGRVSFTVADPPSSMRRSSACGPSRSRSA